MTNIEFNFTLVLLILSTLEILGQKLLIESFFRFGIPFSRSVFNHQVDVSHDINKTIVKPEGKFKFISKTECIFASRFHFFSFFRFESIIPTKNICTIKNGKYEVISKLPLGMTLFILYMMVLFFLNYVTEPVLDINALFPVIFLLVITAMYFIEHHRVGVMKKELREILGLNETADSKA
ncbi:MAG: hypothetical protein EPN93_18160 [Spirochaetes bacterium]|nr:MAG: hypothetical protein EPN93_18160 [Spirochaetota bacterium]